MSNVSCNVSWKDKIAAIKVAANAVSEKALSDVESALKLGEQHMQYKDHRDFDCSCAEEYIFGEAEHLIEQYRLPFKMSLGTVIHDRVFAEELDAEVKKESSQTNNSRGTHDEN